MQSPNHSAALAEFGTIWSGSNLVGFIADSGPTVPIITAAIAALVPLLSRLIDLYNRRQRPADGGLTILMNTLAGQSAELVKLRTELAEAKAKEAAEAFLDRQAAAAGGAHDDLVGFEESRRDSYRFRDQPAGEANDVAKVRGDLAERHRGG